MDWIIGLALLVVGGIIGFFIARHLYTAAASAAAANQQEQSTRNVMSQQALHHIHNSRQTLEQIMRECDTMKNQLDTYEGMMEERPSDNADEFKLNFFGDQASEYLRNKQASEKRAASSADVQPKDFAGESSGLFVGKNEQEVADNR